MSSEAVRALRRQADLLEKVEAATEKMIKAKQGNDPVKARKAKDELRALRAEYRSAAPLAAHPGDATVRVNPVTG